MTGITILLLAVLLGLIPAAIAQRKGHDFVGFWIFGAAIFLLALPVALMMQPNLSGKRRCPHCREYVVVDATVCKHCQRDLPPLPVAGWYPEGKGERWWDGKAWTAQVRQPEQVDGAS